MKITKKLEVELIQLIETYWDSYAKGDLQTWASFLPDNYRNIGTTQEEIWNSKEEIVNYTKTVIDQMVGNFEFRRAQFQFIPFDPNIMIHEFGDIYVKIKEEWTFYSKIRMSSLLQKDNTGWKIIHQHGSYPDSKTVEGQAFAFDTIKAENTKLREAVKHRTIELEQKNSELEIEGALEKVRTIAMGMRKPDDMLDVCKTISLQLQSLGVKEIRNVQTEIINEQKGTYLNYQYFTAYDRGIVEDTEYNKHPKVFEFVQEIKRSENSTFNGSFEGEELNRFREYRKQDNQFPDPLLDEATSMHYYFYSIGSGGLGLSTYKPLNDKALEIFKRFHNVFSLAYRRFVDIEKAESQAREAQIEASLERVRAVAMGMNKSNDLLSICEVSFNEFKKLGFDNLRNSLIHILDDEKEFFLDYDFSDSTGGKITRIFYKSHPIVENYLTQIRSAEDAFAEIVINGSQLKDWKDFRLKTGQQDDPRLNNIQALYYYGYSIGVGDITISTFKPIDESQIQILKRFRNVFDLAYRRYTDIALAEAQAREAQIELSLERVRARTMAMHNSSELADAAGVLFQQFVALGISPKRCFIGIIDKDKKSENIYLTSSEGKVIPGSDSVPMMEQKYLKEIYNAWKNKKGHLYYRLQGQERVDWTTYIMNKAKMSVPEYTPDKINPEQLQNEPAVFNYFFFSNGHIGLHTVEDISEVEISMLKRFAAVFEQTYTRFLDLQKAEAQVREAKIEAALERVRSRTIGMQKSEELKEVIQVVYDQFVHLKINVDHAGFVVDYTPKGDWHFWIADEQEIPSKITHPYFDSVWASQFNEAKENGADFFATNLNFEEKNKFYNELLSYVLGLPEASKDFYLSCPGLAATTVLFDDVSLYIENFSGKPYTEEENKILMRFGKVFQQTYTRFLDLQKAEAQAKEAKIEASLERVRAVAMSMLKSDELLKVCESVFNELRLLGFSETDLRNTQIVINNDEKQIYNGYQYSDYTGGEIAEVPYDMHPIIRMLNDKLKKSTDAFADIEISGKAMDDWKAFVKSFPQKPDEKLYNASELHYYFYSVGIGALGISSFQSLPEAKLQILQRLRNVFNLSYQRYVDISQAEAQAREAQIELALERVRARTMAMYKSEELSETAHLLFQQFKEIDKEPKMLTIGIMNEIEELIEFWVTDWSGGGSKVDRKFNASIDEPILLNKIYKAWKKKQKSIVIELSKEELLGWVKYRISLSGIPDSTDYSNSRGFVAAAFFSKGILSISTYDPISDETTLILERFAGVFNITYTRFLDLQKAEAQAREAQIEAALERVRSRTMGMQKSDELKDAAILLFQQIKTLGVETGSCGFNIWEKEDRSATVWVSSPEGGLQAPFKLPHTASFIYRQVFESMQNGEEFLVREISGAELKKHFDYLLTVPVIGEIIKNLRETSYTFPKTIIYHFAFFKQGYLSFHLHEPCPEAWDIFKRFATVFEQTYTRFLDLQKAEAQARENQIQLALERARAQSMMMQHSKELDDTLRVFHEQVLQLGIPSAFSYLWLPDEEKERHIFWAAWAENNSTVFKSKAINYPMDRNEPATAQCIIDWKGKEPVVSYHVPPAGVKSYFAAWQELIDGVEQLKPEYFFSGLYYVEAFMKYGCFGVMIKSELSEEEKKILYRFTIEFERAYTRFLDLQKAETQAREAQIEAALEKVRTVALSLKKSDEMLDIAQVLYEQLIELGFSNIRNAIIDIHNDNNETFLDYDYSHDMGRTVTLMSYQDDPIIEKQVRQIESSSDAFFELILEGQELQYLIDMRLRNGENEDPRLRQIEQLTYNLYSFGNGAIGISNFGLLSDEQKIVLKRFRNVFAFAYKRYTDMVIAETQAREAKKQASLDRIRAEIASMRTSEDLNHITPIIWRELKNLEVPFIRCGVFIVDEDKEYVHVYLTTPDGKSLAALNLSFDANELTSNAVYHWRNKQVFKEHWTKKEFINWTKSMIELGQVEKSETYQGSSTPPETLHLHFIPFAQGMLYVGDVSPLTDDKLTLVKTLAEAFSIAYSRYEDFKNLEDAKNRVEVTLTELKSAQAQLVQAEKLASLGQLTAGIAHEIKNPLNFVNNFSEISSELLEEMKIELQNDNKDEAIAIAEDIKRNLEKINQHGKRADSIVKGMLLHSRGSAGEKSLTNLNDLLEQYVNLAYHGLRAQDKEFNITIQKDFDETLEKINVVPQDISRVFLNIVNNGFYAANEKKKKSENDFAPILKVSTKNLPDKVEIRIRDNGNGIPQSIKNNIFNPFFTTKPAGEGTGLGLSLSYDIITKVHNGEIIFDTKENEFTECIITIPRT